MMIPRILGVYCSEKTEKIGEGGTARDVVQKIYWFALQADNERFVVYPLDDKDLPMALTQNVTLKDFLSNYTPEPAMYRDNIHPLILSIKTKTERGDDAFTGPALQLLKTLGLMKNEVETDLGERDLALGILNEAGLDREHLELAQTQNINTFGIQLRKDNNFDGAITYYKKALDINPGDDHVYFNIARAYFDKKEYGRCRAYLQRALELNPDFPEAAKFNAYLEHNVKMDEEEDFPDIELKSDMDDRRKHRRFDLRTNRIKHLCEVQKGDERFKAALLDISRSGARLLLPKTHVGAVVQGDDLIIRPQLPLTGNGDQTIRGAGRWSDGAQFGVLFENEIALDLEEIQEILTKEA